MSRYLGRDLDRGYDPQRSDRSRFLMFARVGAIANLVGFALSGTLKEFPLLTVVPIDLTQLTGIAALGLGLVYRLDDRSLPSRTQMAMVALFVFVVLLGSTGALNTEYGTLKATKALQVSFLGVLGASLAIKTRDDLKLFTYTFLGVAFAAVVPLAVGAEGYRDQFGRFTSEGGSTINLGQAAGVVLYGISAYLLVHQRRLTLRRISALAAVGGVSAYVLLGVGSRGPLQGLVIAVVFAAIGSMQASTMGVNKRLAMLAGAAVGVVLVVWSATPESSRERIVEFGGNSTADTRVTLWESTWRELDFDLFGSGFGSWQLLGVEDYTYPHNMFLELWYETGLIGMVATSSFLLIPIVRRFRSLSVDPLLGLLSSGFVVYYWAGAMVSGDFNDHRALWLLAMVAASPAIAPIGSIGETLAGRYPRGEEAVENGLQRGDFRDESLAYR